MNTRRQIQQQVHSIDELSAAAATLQLEHKEEAVVIDEKEEETESEADEENKYAEDEKENTNPNPRPRKKRGHYHPRLSDPQRLEVVRLHVSDGMGPSKIVSTLRMQGIHSTISTIKSILKTHRDQDRIKCKTPLPKHKYRPSDEKIVVDLQMADNGMTLTAIRNEWQKLTGSDRKMSIATISRMLVKNRITTKNLVPVPVARNTPETIAGRAEYAMEAMTWERSSLVFVDETGFTTHLHRKRGRSARGQLATVPETNNPGARINICAAVSPHWGLIMWEYRMTSWDQDEFSRFLNTLCKRIEYTHTHPPITTPFHLVFWSSLV